MSETERMMEAARRAARHKAEAEWLAQRYEMLERQTKVLTALQHAQNVYWPQGDQTGVAIIRLKTHCARVIVATCEGIMRHSGLTDLDHSDWGDQAAAPSGEAREETIPW